MAHYSPHEIAKDRAGRNKVDIGLLRAALAELEGVGGKVAEACRRSLERRIAAAETRAAERAELEARTPAEIVAGISR